MVLSLMVKGWAKYNARNDVKSCTWFRMSNDFFADPDFYGAALQTRIVWIYILCTASKKNNETVRINLEMVADTLKITKQNIEKTINELINMGCLEILDDDRISTRSDSIVRKMFPSATDRQTDRQTDRELNPSSNEPFPDVRNHDYEQSMQPSNNAASINKKPDIEAEVLNLLNSMALKSFKTVEAHRKYIRARLGEGYTIDDFKTVIKSKYDEWGNDAEWAAYLRPSTLFGTKFDGYLQAAKNKPKTADELLLEVFAEGDLNVYPWARIDE